MPDGKGVFQTGLLLYMFRALYKLHVLYSTAQDPTWFSGGLDLASRVQL